MRHQHFFKNSSALTKVSNIVNAGGPNADEQLFSMANGDYWVVLNSGILSLCPKKSDLCYRANALKIALQTYGPSSKELPDCRVNEGKAKNQVYHGHVNDSNGTTYVLEWAIIDSNKKIMALIGFDSHENYAFRKTKLTNEEIKKILDDKKNIKIFNHAQEKVEEAKIKINSSR